MGVLFVFIAVICFVIADFLIRKYLEKQEQKEKRIERAKALESNLKLDFSHESKSLKRVEVKNPIARILAVDDEAIILDSFRKILVLEGYAIDTVETGQEALGLVQKRDYDFVFSDLKMPEMDGVDVCKSVKHLRPDIDVIIITGYASVESAVETMKFGAMDYIQKPFSENELVAMVKKFQIKREERIAKRIHANVTITHKEEDGPEKIGFQIPGGVFISKGHCWSKIRPTGVVDIGVDDFARKLIGKIDAIKIDEPGKSVDKGAVLFTIVQKEHEISFHAPVSGQIVSVNHGMIDSPGDLESSAYGQNFICSLQADHLDSDLTDLFIGNAAVEFIRGEIDRLNSFVRNQVKSTKDEKVIPADGQAYIGELAFLNDADFNLIIRDFFKP